MALTDQLISYWKFDESSGNAADSHGANTLTNTNTATFGTGKINNGTDLEEDSSQYFTNATDLGITGGACSYSLWLKPESTPAADTGGYLIYQEDAGNDVGFQINYRQQSSVIELM